MIGTGIRYNPKAQPCTASGWVLYLVLFFKSQIRIQTTNQLSIGFIVTKLFFLADKRVVEQCDDSHGHSVRYYQLKGRSNPSSHQVSYYYGSFFVLQVKFLWFSGDEAQMLFFFPI